ncbi:NAD(P)/FAD-dependent oxidoreductase [Luteimonas vadosa]|uniref:Kynurenine 3-monooxygenase n=1 Tax=Luteimonas vadosa TaxID=1165507 RepID=A0ABP9E148_9GAMM
MTDRRLTIVGAGLAGALFAALLARKGWQVDVFEKRGDPRVKGYEGGRSINLALAERGLHALKQADADGPVMAQAVMMRGRMVHFLDGRVELQRYGRDDSEVIWSVHRGDLNITLLDIAERAGARLHFHRGFVDADFDGCVARYRDGRDGHVEAVPFVALVGADGAGSQLRAAMDAYRPVGERSEFLDHSYKELEIPPAPGGGFRIEPNALHIWPRGRYMCIALPNDEKTFTVTLFLPNESPGDDVPSFANVRSPAEARALFERDFPDALPLIPALEQDWARNPPGLLGTLTLERWHLDRRAVLVGDAAHAMVPFHGQGMNCAFEDCVDLARRLQGEDDLGSAFAAFESARKPNASAIQRMALDNYLEMRDRVDDPDFLLQRALEQVLQERHPGRFIPHYAMVTFMRIPYALALARSEIQRVILEEATEGVAALSEVDLAAADAAVLESLPPLQDAAPP